MICSYLIFPFPIVIIHFLLFGKKKVDLFFCRRFVCKSAGTQLFYENTASAFIATSLLLLQATERRNRKTTHCWPARWRTLLGQVSLSVNKGVTLGGSVVLVAGPLVHWPIWDRQYPGGGLGQRGQQKTKQTFHWERAPFPALRRAPWSSCQSHAACSALWASLRV